MFYEQEHMCRGDHKAVCVSCLDKGGDGIQLYKGRVENGHKAEFFCIDCWEMVDGGAVLTYPHPDLN